MKRLSEENIRTFYFSNFLIFISFALTTFSLYIECGDAKVRHMSRDPVLGDHGSLLILYRKLP
ncbi:hypothetical protein LEP1GSC168_1148 [Leptospira santarosai str. HAI134]|uniref:hypothetical protein n=1 Tax=Leptospira santarosai TaxID=28183 RepID=UPI0002BE89EA|nr:hypothetical protein [Leptospira santarosai]EMO23338.1 hypothetical protein LEP1GSC168_1148 [Leptospira santarosai str. HAI134]